MAKKTGERIPATYTKTRAVFVYPTPFPLRAVGVADDGVQASPRFERFDLRVVGIQATITDTYHGSIPVRSDEDPMPRSSAEADIVAAGFRLGCDGDVLSYQVLVWDAELMCPVTAYEYGSQDCTVVVAPDDAPPDEWEAMLKKAEADLAKRAEQRVSQETRVTKGPRA